MRREIYTDLLHKIIKSSVINNITGSSIEAFVDLKAKGIPNS